MQYKCMFPNCMYTVDSREKIDEHHIIPRSQGGSNKRNNKIYLCPSHHRHVYIPKAQFGIHSFKSQESIIILGFLSSTMGMGLRYIDCADNKEYAFMYSKNVVIPLC
jgi:hypothetical protein